MINNNTPHEKSNKNNTDVLQDDMFCNSARLQEGHQLGGHLSGGLPAGEGLSYAHNRPQGGKVQIWNEGNLIKAISAREGKKTGGGKRGKVKGFSRASRRRMMYMLCQTKKQKKPLFVTLTYPDIFSQNPKTYKRDLKVFFQRLMREYPTAGAVWRLEFKRRLTGTYKGDPAPHFHLLVWGVEYKAMKCFVKDAWWGAVGSENEDHHKAGTKVEVVRHKDGVKRYASKYASKNNEDNELFLEVSKRGAPGRVWGIFNSNNIPWSQCFEIETDNQAVIKLFRLMRRYAHLKMRSNTPSMTLMVNDPMQWIRPLIC